MRHLKFFIPVFAIFVYSASLAQATIAVKHFNKVIISPHIQVTFVEGDNEGVTIDNSTVSNDKIIIEVKNNTLRIYLDGAKEIDKNQTTRENRYKQKHHIYNGTVVKATVTYKTMNVLSIRGDESQLCKSPIRGDKFTLRIYGESHVVLNEVNLGVLQTTVYGEGSLEIKSGVAKNQKYTSYGEGKINSLAVSGNTGQITAYGEANIRLNVSDEIKITSFGDSKLEYKGNPEISKGLNIGGTQISRID